MKILRRESYRRVPWRNGAGETEEIALCAAPDGSGDFDWRISMAPVLTAGPFSEFPAIDRILTVIEGAGLRLEWTDGGLEGGLDCLPGKPVPFPGDRPCKASLLGGPIVDLNVMTRRGRWQASVRKTSELTRQPTAAHHLIFALDGPVGARVDGTEVALSEKDTLWLSAPFPREVTLDGTWLDIQLTPVPPA